MRDTLYLPKIAMDCVNSCLRWTTIDEGIKKLSKIGLVYTALLSLQSWGGVGYVVGWVGWGWMVFKVIFVLNPTTVKVDMRICLG